MPQGLLEDCKGDRAGFHISPPRSPPPPLQRCHLVSFSTGSSCQVSFEDNIPLINPLSRIMLPPIIQQISLASAKTQLKLHQQQKRQNLLGIFGYIKFQAQQGQEVQTWTGLFSLCLASNESRSKNVNTNFRNCSLSPLSASPLGLIILNPPPNSGFHDCWQPQIYNFQQKDTLPLPIRIQPFQGKILLVLLGILLLREYY